MCVCITQQHIRDVNKYNGCKWIFQWKMFKGFGCMCAIDEMIKAIETFWIIQYSYWRKYSKSSKWKLRYKLTKTILLAFPFEQRENQFYHYLFAYSIQNSTGLIEACNLKFKYVRNSVMDQRAQERIFFKLKSNLKARKPFHLQMLLFGY